MGGNTRLCTCGPILLKHLSKWFVLCDKWHWFYSYADDNAIYDSGNSIDDVISSLKES